MAWLQQLQWLAAAALTAVTWQCALGQVPLPRNAPIEVCERQGRNGGEVSPDCGQHWVILNEVNVPEFWEVHEVEFYWDRYCTLHLPEGDAIASEINTAFEDNTPRRVWDGLLWTKWTANCRALLGGCQPRAAYVGKDIGGGVLGVNVDPSTNYSSVRCLRVWQSPNISRQSLQISLGVFGNNSASSLEVLQVYSEFAGGAWQSRPPFEAGLWRLWNHGATVGPWRVAELLLFSDRFCTKLESHGVPISSGSFMPDDCITTESCDPYLPWKAFDGVKKPGHSFPEPLPTFWQAPCHPFEGCRELAAWIGVDFGFSPVTIQCIQIFQPTHEGYPDFGSPTFTSTLLIEFWDGVKWKENDILTDLGHGEWFQTRPRYGMAWRLHNYDRVPESWRVYELQLFESRDCGTLDSRDREYGDPIDSNPKLPFSEQDLECRKLTGSCGFLAHDLDERSTWQSRCSRCEQGEAWVGLLFKHGLPRMIQCFRLIQSGELEYRTDAVELAMWTGEEWEVKRFESGVGGDTWNYRPSQPMTGWRLMGMSATEEPWTMLDIAFYSDSACNHELQAQEIGSGGTPAHRVELAFDHDNLTQFEASCSPPYTGSLGCASGSTWLGIQVGSGTLELNCLLLRQHRTRTRQVASALLEYWDGIRWTQSNKFEPFVDFGGGTWQTLPGSYGSFWRLRSQTVPGGVGVGVAELELYTSSDCTGKIEAGFPVIAPVSSGFATIREVFLATGSSAHFMTMGDAGEAVPSFAFDGDIGTFWAELDLGPTWVGLDLTTGIADVQCVRLVFAGLRLLQPAWSWIEAWDGTAWSTAISGGAESVLNLALPFPGGAGWQQRPALPKSMWRIENNEEVLAWDVAEVEFHTSTDCSGALLQGLPIASAQTTPTGVLHGGHQLPRRAFDGNRETFWSADCEYFGCLAGNAWIGLQLEVPERVRCLRMVQGGRRSSQVSTVSLAFWNGERWEVELKHSGLSGGTWSRRPAMPDTLWRMVYMGRQDEACPSFPLLGVKRSWGISELEFYADDACTVQLPGVAEGAEPIASSMRVPDNPAGGIMLDSFAPKWAFDGSTNSYWAAQCGVIGREEAQCEPGEEWIGLDFSSVSRGMPVEVPR